MLSQKRRQYFVYWRAFWQRRCRAAAAEAVLKPLGGNCAVLPQVNLLGNTGVFAVLLIIQCGVQPIAGNAQHQRTGCHGSDSQHSSDQGPAGLVPLQ